MSHLTANLSKVYRIVTRERYLSSKTSYGLGNKKSLMKIDNNPEFSEFSRPEVHLFELILELGNVHLLYTCAYTLYLIYFLSESYQSIFEVD